MDIEKAKVILNKFSEDYEKENGTGDLAEGIAEMIIDWDDNEAIKTILSELEKKDKIIDKIYDFCRRELAFEKRLKREKRKPDEFNQGRFYVCKNIKAIITNGNIYLNDEVEIIEEQQDVDIQSIEEIDDNFSYIENHSSGLGIEKVFNKAEIELSNKINELVQAVKQLDKKIKEKE